jgi:hypothetical protein
LNTKKSLLVAAAVATVGVSGVALTHIASAQTTAAGGSSLVDRLASKFSLNKSDVQAVFNEDKAAHQAEKQKLLSDRLQAAVDSGKLTAEQKTLIESKLKELQTVRDNEMKDLQAWADQNKIDLKYVMFGHKPGNEATELQSLVDKGTITAEQKTLIENKQKELQQKRDTERQALEKWAADNKVDQQYLKFGGVGHKMIEKSF